MTSASPAFADVSGLLSPDSIAVVGASDQERSLGGAAVAFLQKFGYQGQVWPVHPSAATVGGLPAFPNVAALPAVPDLVVLAIAAARIPGALRECAAAGVKSAVVWAGGFAEGGEEGAELQAELVDIANEAGIALLGPNCIGVIDTKRAMTATFASFLRDADSLPSGNISMIGQSGGLVTMSMAYASADGYGFRYAISTGNEAVLTVPDFIAACAVDPETKVIALYMEGTDDGEQLIASLELAREHGKPVVMLHGGASDAAARAAAAHTGALAGSGRVWSSVMRELGVIETGSLEELLDVAEQLSSAPERRVAKGPGLAIVTFGGGSGVLCADQATARGLTVARLDDATRETLIPLVPPIASVGNPIDLTPQVFTDPQWLAKLPEALDVLDAADGVDAVLLQFGPMAAAAIEMAQVAIDFMARASVPVLLCWPQAPAVIPGWLKERGVHCFTESDRAIRVISHFAAEGGFGPTSPVEADAVDWTAVVPDPAPGLVLAEYRAYGLLEAAGLAVAPGRLVQSAAEAAAAASELGWPVALKGMSEEITHKFAAGLVKLGASDAAGAEQLAGELFDRGRELGVELDGVFVQRMITKGTELLVSALRDPVFGVVVSVGAGGVMTELIDDVVLHQAPFAPEVAKRMLQRLRVLKKFDAGTDLDAMSAYLSRFSQVVAGIPWSEFVLEVNPVKLSPEGPVAVDGLFILEAL